MSQTILLTVILPLIIVFMFFLAIINALETAITTLNFAKLKQFMNENTNNPAPKKRQKAKRQYNAIYKLARRYDETIITILFASTILNTSIATLATLFLSGLILNNATAVIFINTIVLGIILLLFCEIIPKIIARNHAETIVTSYFFLFRFLLFLFSPFLLLIRFWKKIKPPAAFITNTEKELLELINIIENEGTIELKEKKLIESAIIFDEKKVLAYMTPLKDLISLQINDSYATFRTIYLEHRYTRIPVFNEKKTAILGIVNIKNVLGQLLRQQTFVLKNLITPCYFIADDLSLDLALEQFQKTEAHIFAVLHKNTKTVVGIITLEDVLEELVGEIYDEDDLTGFVKEIGHHMWIVHEATSTKTFFNKNLHLSTQANEHHLKMKDWFNKQNIQNNKVIYKNYLFRRSQKKKYFEVEALSNNNLTLF